MMTWDVVIVGAGIAGASLAAFLPQDMKVLMLERESQPGYHATGRSAAVFSETYGPPLVRALSRASRPFLSAPPEGFCEHPLLSPRGVLLIAETGQEALLAKELALLGSTAPQVQRLDPAATVALLPVLREARVAGALFDPDVCDIDVHALHQALLRRARAGGLVLRCDAALHGIQRTEAGWRLSVGDTELETRLLVNAAGAWADELAGLAGLAPLGLEPRRRSAFTLAAPPQADIAGWPMAVGLDETWYLKPDAGQLLASSANADPTHPQDVQPEELDIALGLHRLQEMTTLEARRPRHTWAGLRSFLPDGAPAAGFDRRDPNFFWLAGQGGYGIQTAPALGMAAAALLCGQAFPEAVLQQGITAAALSPGRFDKD